MHSKHDLCVQESASEEVHTLVSQILQSLYTVYKQIKLEVDQQQATGQKTHFRLVSAGNTVKNDKIRREWNKWHIQ